MNGNGSPTLEARGADAITQELLARLPAYVAGWDPVVSGPSWAVLHIFARYGQVLIERLNQAPDKNKLAFLDMLGISLLPAQAARAPVVFQAVPKVGDSRVPARTRVGAKVPGLSDPLVFETENAIALTAARLVEVVTLWPARDAYADHSTALGRGEPFTLFQPLRPVPHELYLAHDTLFAFAGEATIEIEFELSTPGSVPLTIVWEYWDGQVWRPFKASDRTDPTASQDGTDGLSHSGVITLRAECGQAEKTTVKGIDAHWVRGRLDQVLAPDPAHVIPMVDRIRVRSAIDRAATDWEVQQQEGSGSLGIRGTVRDRQGVPLPGLTVERVLLSSIPPPGGPPTTHTDAQGRYAFAGGLADRDYKLTVSHPQLPRGQAIVHLDTSLVQADFILTLGLRLSGAFADGLKLDVSKTFFPLGQQPQPGSTFYLSSREVFGKPGATMTVWVKFDPARQVAGVVQRLASPEVAWEYWNRDRWISLGVELVDPASLGEDFDPPHFKTYEEDFSEGAFRIRVPTDMTHVEVSGQEGLWMRARLLTGGYGFKRTITWTDSSGPNTIELIETVPPALADMRLGYSYRSAWERPEHCLSYNDFQFEDHSRDVHWPGAFFAPFRPLADSTPALYLGFDRPLPADLISLYLDIQEEAGENEGPRLKWEYWDDTAWRPLTVQDETNNLALPGMVAALWPGVPVLPAAAVVHASGPRVQVSDTRQALRFAPGEVLYIARDGDGELATLASVARDTLTLETPLSRDYSGATIGRATLPRFGTPRTWIRARLEEDSAPLRSQLAGVHLNAVWAAQLQTVENEVLGSSDDQPGQAVFLRQTPALEGEMIEVREIQGARAAVELPILREELLQRGLTDDDIRTVMDRRSGAISEVWVRWRGRPHLFFSSPDDRHYMIERSRGRVIFGDNQRGLIPPAGPDGLRAQVYRAGGGLTGNVSSGAIAQLLSGVLAQGVSNPRAGEGGADGESIIAVSGRGPHTLRHRGRTLSARDYEALAREASPGVAVARALPTTHPSGRPAAGWVTVIIVPQSLDAEPHPSFELRRRVRDFLAARAPAAMTSQIAVLGPTYLPIGVEAVVAPLSPPDAGVVLERVRGALARFLHPLTGGPEGAGWPFGRDVYLSDVAAILEAIEGVDFVPTINLLLDGTPRGERVAVPPDRIVVAGPLQVSLTGGET